MPRFSFALLCALALHGLLLLARTRALRDASPRTANAQRAAQSIELEEFPVEEAPLLADPVEPISPAAPLAARAEPRAPDTAVSRGAGALAKSASEQAPASQTSPETTPATDLLAAPVAAGSADAGDARAARKIDLGLDGHFFLHDPGSATAAGPAPAAELGPRVRKSTAQRQLDAALSADDVQRGLARGNALLGSLHDAARADGPLRGEAIFRATVSADGSLGNVELLRGSALEWPAVLSAFRKLAASKHVRLPAGAKGLRVTFSIKAKVQRPSGKDANDTAIGVADPSLGPNGLLPNGDFDLADLGAAPQRLVYARVVAEEVL